MFCFCVYDDLVCDFIFEVGYEVFGSRFINSRKGEEVNFNLLKMMFEVFLVYGKELENE